MRNRTSKFKNEDEEREFWATHDSTNYLDWSKASRVLFPNLKPTARLISIRLPDTMIQELKSLANKWDIPYQSLLKMFLAERIEKELRPTQSSKRTKPYGLAA
jgi:predicted DNA binding CopG/RHH family protein